MAGHLKPPVNLGPVNAFHKELLLSTVRPCHLSKTPNRFLKWALDYRILADVLEQIEESAYLAEYNAFYTHALKCLKVDDKHRFVILLTKHHDLVEKFPPFGLFEDVCKHKAVDCAAAFLQSGFSLDLNTPFEVSHCHPLDFGALHLSPSLTHLLLQNGADPNIHSCHGSPLLRALRELCFNDYVKQWKDDTSIFKLLYIFCLPDLNEPFATIKLLASHTKQIEEVYAYIIENGDVVQLASLLMAAKDQLLVPSAEGGLETTPIGQYILGKLKLDSDQESQLMTDSKTTNIHLSNPTPLVERYKNAYYVIKIMWNAIDILDSYRSSEWIKNVLDYEVPFDIAHDLVNDANFFLNPEDVFCNDIDCLRPSITLKAEVLSKRICFGKQLRSSSSQHPLVGNPAMGASLFSSFSMASFPHHSYHTWQAVNFNTIKPTESQSTHVKPSSCNFTTSAGKPATSLGASQFPSPPSMSTPHHASHTYQAVNFYNIRPVGINNVLASARVCAPLIRIAKRSIK